MAGLNEVAWEWWLTLPLAKWWCYKFTSQNLQSRVSRGVALQTGKQSDRQERMVFQVRTLEDGKALRMIDLMERKIIVRAQRPQEGWRC